jgi:hypothetical protein
LNGVRDDEGRRGDGVKRRPRAVCSVFHEKIQSLECGGEAAHALMPVPPTHSLRSQRPSRDPPIFLAQLVPSSARRRAARRKSQESCVSGQKRHKTSSSPSRVEPRVDAPTRTLHISAPAPKGRRTCARIAAWTQCIATAKGRGQRVLRHANQLPLLGRACHSLVHREPGSRRVHSC